MTVADVSPDRTTRARFAIEQLEFWGRISLLKGGINFADLVTTERWLAPVLNYDR